LARPNLLIGGPAQGVEQAAQPAAPPLAGAVDLHGLLGALHELQADVQKLRPLPLGQRIAAHAPALRAALSPLALGLVKRVVYPTKLNWQRELDRHPDVLQLVKDSVGDVSSNIAMTTEFKKLVASPLASDTRKKCTRVLTKLTQSDPPP
jgi:hypothetical protein